MVAPVAGRLVLTSSAVLAIVDGVRRKIKRLQQDGARRCSRKMFYCGWHEWKAMLTSDHCCCCCWSKAAVSPAEGIHHAPFGVQFHPCCRMLLGRSTPCRDQPSTRFPPWHSRTSVIRHSAVWSATAIHIERSSVILSDHARPTRNGVVRQRFNLVKWFVIFGR